MSENTTGADPAGAGTDPGKNGKDDGGFDAASWQAFAEESGLSPAELKRRLEHSRTWEKRAKENKSAADTAKTLEQQVEELRGSLAKREQADAERNAKLAMSQVKSALADKGVRMEDVKDLLAEIDPAARLLDGGDVDDQAVERLAASLARAAGRPAPDPDQGRKGGTPPSDMNQLIRRASGVGQR